MNTEQMQKEIYSLLESRSQMWDDFAYFKADLNNQKKTTEYISSKLGQDIHLYKKKMDESVHEAIRYIQEKNNIIVSSINRTHRTSRRISWAAILLSCVSIAMSGYVMYMQ